MKLKRMHWRLDNYLKSQVHFIDTARIFHRVQYLAYCENHISGMFEMEAEAMAYLSLSAEKC